MLIYFGRITQKQVSVKFMLNRFWNEEQVSNCCSGSYHLVVYCFDLGFTLAVSLQHLHTFFLIPLYAFCVYTFPGFVNVSENVTLALSQCCSYTVVTKYYELRHTWGSEVLIVQI